MTAADEQRYQEAMHGVQTGVLVSLKLGISDECSPKHLRVGVNSALVSASAVAELLIDAGVFTRDQYIAKLAHLAELELASYQDRMPARRESPMKAGTYPMGDTTVDVYAVGFVCDAWPVLRAVRRFGVRHPHTRRFVRSLCRWVRLSWRRRSYWNGYLAEPATFPPGLKRCGSGWTPRRAFRDLERRMDRL